MTFANPLLLAGLAAAVLPLVLHLLARARARTIDWGATPLLPGMPDHASACGRLRQILLMVSRCAVVATLAFALARPSTFAGGAADAPAAVVLVLDASPSMLNPERSGTRFELARRVALDRLSRLVKGEQAGLVVLGVVPTADVPLTPDLQSVASQIASLSTGVAPADLAEGERRARAMLSDAGVDGGEVLLIADRQRSAWEPLRQTTADPGPRVIASPVGSAQTNNAWVESIELLNPPAIRGAPARFSVTLRNDGDVPQGALTLRVAMAGTEASVGPVAIEARGQTRVVRIIAPGRVGPATVTASISPTGMPGDDTLRRAIDVREPPRVGLPGTAVTPPWLKELAGIMVVDSVTADDLSGVDVAVLNDAAPDGRTVAAVEQFVANGGGLLLAPGPALSRAEWNQRLWKSGFGFAPPVSADIRPVPPVRPEDVPAFAEPMSDVADWRGLTVTRYWRLAASGGETVLGRLGTNAFLVERSFGRGRVVAVALPLDGQWTTNADPAAYAGLAEALVKRLVDRAVDRNVDVGVPLEMAVRMTRDRSAIVSRPDGRYERSGLNVVDGQGLFRYTRTDVPGRYVVRMGEQSPTDWYVRQDASESQMSPLDDAALDGLLAAAGVERVAPAVVPRRSSDWALGLMIVVGALLAAELALASAYLPTRERR